MMKYCMFIAVAGAALLAGCEKKETSVPDERIVRVVTMQPEEREFTQRIRVQGNVESKEHAEISSRTNGSLDQIPVSEGDAVKKGATLFQVDRINLENDLKVRLNQVKVAEAQLKIAEISRDLAVTVCDKAKTDFLRAEKLKASQAVSEDAYERAKLSYEEAESNILKAEAQANFAKATLGQSQANLEIAEKLLADSLVAAPFDGTVISKSKEPGEYVKSGEVIVKLENPARLELVTMISAVYYPRIIPGKTMAVIYAPDGEKRGELPVSFRSPSVDPLSRTFEIKIDLPETWELVSGQLCDMDLILRSARGKGVPNEAILLRANNRRIVFTAEKNNTAAAVAVETGIVDGAWTMLPDPAVLENRPVIIEGQAFLEPGDRIAVTEETK